MSSAWRFVLADSLETVLPTVEPRAHADSGGPRGGGSVFLGEPYSVQVAFRPPPAGRTGSHAVQFTLSGSAAPHASIFAVDLVPARMPAFPDHDDNYLVTEPGLYPDVLRPIPDGRVEPLVGHWRSVWIDVRVDPDAAPAGVEAIDLDLIITATRASTGEELYATTVPVTVINQPLPDLDLVNTQWLHADCVLDYYGGTAFDEGHWAALDQFIGSAARMGVTGLLTPLWTPPLDTAIGSRRTPVQLIDIARDGGDYRFGFDKLGRWLELFRRHGIAYVELSHLFTQWGAKATPAIDAVVDGTATQLFGWDVAATDPEYRRFLEALLPQLRSYLAERWDPAKIIFHISDEPHQDQLDSYQAARAVVADLLEGCLIVDALSDYAFYTSGVVANPIVATNHVKPFLDAGVERLWVYYCVSQNKLVANRFIGMPAARHRVLGHQLFAADAGGFLHWGFNFYNAQQSRYRVDPFTDTTSGGAFPAGDPFIVYPGPDRTVWESTRHRVAAQAMHDHRAMQLLRDRAGRETVLKIIDPDGALSFSAYPRDPEHFLASRERINAAIRAGG
ncbi:DUF4091 domain-containing protein [Microlunatus speluncae]|uniref:DUF4091 domain-containing protein n=1 Tax=Microlunatus speluncae TaxID=2594267 RepID=UPI0012665A3A|nr:DUF4091 domain-containing protein [Microlunatus speluncae]